MRLKVSKSPNSETLYVIESTYINGKNSSRIVERLGTVQEIRQQHPDQDPYQWARSYIAELNKQDAKKKEAILVKLKPQTQISKNRIVLFNGGYLFVQQLYYRLGLHKLCRQISQNYKFTYDLNQILSYLVYARILYPCSKRATVSVARHFLQPAKLKLQQVYRSLSILGRENDRIQTWLYKYSLKLSLRNTRILYYDLTNFYFEIEEADEPGSLRQYGVSKKNRPNPLVQLGLFMDGDGIPLAFDVTPGNTNEQVTLKPLEKRILKDFNLSQFIVCTDAGLSSLANRKFNTLGQRAYVTTQSLKKIKEHLREWALDPAGWLLNDDEKIYNLDKLDEKEHHKDVFYKERWINEDGLEQRLLVSFSFKRRDYDRHIRQGQIERAQKAIDKDPAKLERKRQTDYKRLAKSYKVTDEGEVAQHTVYALDNAKIAEEAAYDGFYAICTNLEGDVQQLLRINRGRSQAVTGFYLIPSVKDDSFTL